jgi:hypothetical protein
MTTFSPNDTCILSVTTPAESSDQRGITAGGPYAVICKGPNGAANPEAYWAIVALDWNNEPRLAIRYFGTFDYPNGPRQKDGKKQKQWFILPEMIQSLVTTKLPQTLGNIVNDFLNGKIDGNSLSEQCNNLYKTNPENFEEVSTPQQVSP